jgi:O-phospho-L-seryl-tRNASec:L-selenocysteinyl-tRNA synthase
LKFVFFLGFTPIIIENILVNDELQTDLVSLEEKINELNPDNICCIFSVSSCFAPRAIDKYTQ